MIVKNINLFFLLYFCSSSLQVCVNQKKKSSSLPPGSHKNLRSCSFLLLLSWGALHLSAVHGKKSSSTVKAIHSSDLRYFLGFLTMSSVYNCLQAKLTVLRLHKLSFIFIILYFFTFSSLCLKCLSPSDKYPVILWTLPKCHLFYTFLILSIMGFLPACSYT